MSISAAALQRYYDASYPPSILGGGGGPTPPPAPVLTSITPNTGPVGTVTTITGTGLSGVYGWLFNQPPGGGSNRNVYPTTETDTEVVLEGVPAALVAGACDVFASYGPGGFGGSTNRLTFTVT